MVNQLFMTTLIIKKEIHFMMPNEARLRNMTYSFPIHYDIDIDFKILTDNEEGKTGKARFLVNEKQII